MFIFAYNLFKNAMKKQEMIQVMIAEEKQLWKDMMECIDKLGMRDPITDIAVARWSSVHKLVCKIIIKNK